MANVIRFILLAMAVFIAATIVAFVYLPWWQALLACFAAMGLLVFLGMIVLQRFSDMVQGRFDELVENTLRDQGKALKGAAVEVHEIFPTSGPPPSPADEFDEEDEEFADDMEDDDELPSAYYRIDMTVTPAPALANEPWDPRALQLIDVQSPFFTPDFDGDEDEGFPLGANIEQVEVYKNGNYVAARTGELRGAQRLRALVELPATAKVAWIYYHFERIGKTDLPKA